MGYVRTSDIDGDWLGFCGLVGDGVSELGGPRYLRMGMDRNADSENRIWEYQVGGYEDGLPQVGFFHSKAKTLSFPDSIRLTLYR